MKTLLSTIKDCLYCHSNRVQKNGILPRGGQRYSCVDCHKHFTVGGKARGTYNEQFKQSIIEQYCHTPIAVRELAAQSHIAPSTIVQRAKKHKKNSDGCSICNHQTKS